MSVNGINEADELTFAGEPTACPYDSARVAERTYRLPVVRPTPQALDARFAAGQRRSGPVFYHQACKTCSGCQSLRIAASSFVRSRSQTRVWKKTAPLIRIEIGEPRIDTQRLLLFAKHERAQGLGQQDECTMNAERYRQTFLQSAAQTVELRYWYGTQLVAVAITDLGGQALSAMYTYFDPDHARLSLGTFSILVQIEFAKRALGSEAWVYLGLYVEASPHLRYKSHFHPHERNIEGKWTQFSSPNLSGGAENALICPPTQD